jgi:hypothetical protein
MTRRRVLLTTAAAGTLLGLTATAAFASWTAKANGSATAKSSAMPAGGQPSKPVATPSTSVGTITVQWPVANYPTVTPTTAVSGYIVKRYVGGTLDGTGPAGNCTGTVAALTCDDTVTLTGAYTYTVTPVSGTGSLWKGAESPASAIYNYTAAPTVTVGTPDLTTASDSGTSNTDNLTNVTTPTFTVAATTNASVQLFDNGVATGSPAVASAGSATVTSGALAGGAGTSHSITAKATLSGTTVTSSALTIVVDTQAPQGLTITGVVGSGHVIDYSGALGTATNDQAAATIIICGTNAFPCGTNNTNAKDLSPKPVTATTSTWSYGSGNLGNNAPNYAQVSQTDKAGNTATAVDGPRTS